MGEHGFEPWTRRLRVVCSTAELLALALGFQSGRSLAKGFPPVYSLGPLSADEALLGW